MGLARTGWELVVHLLSAPLWDLKNPFCSHNTSLQDLVHSTASYLYSCSCCHLGSGALEGHSTQFLPRSPLVSLQLGREPVVPNTHSHVLTRWQAIWGVAHRTVWAERVGPFSRHTSETLPLPCGKQLFLLQPAKVWFAWKKRKSLFYFVFWWTLKKLELSNLSWGKPQNCFFHVVEPFTAFITWLVFNCFIYLFSILISTSTVIIAIRIKSLKY